MDSRHTVSAVNPTEPATDVTVPFTPSPAVGIGERLVVSVRMRGNPPPTGQVSDNFGSTGWTRVQREETQENSLEVWTKVTVGGENQIICNAPGGLERYQMSATVYLLPPSVLAGSAGNVQLGSPLVNTLSTTSTPDVGEGDFFALATFATEGAHGGFQSFTEGFTLDHGPTHSFVGSKSFQGTPPPPPGGTLVSITVTPINTTLGIGQTKQYFATGTYSDQSTANITSSVLWIIVGQPTIATIDGNGLLTAHASGSVGVEAELDGITSNEASVTVQTSNPPPGGGGQQGATEPDPSIVESNTFIYAFRHGPGGDAYDDITNNGQTNGSLEVDESPDVDERHGTRSDPSDHHWVRRPSGTDGPNNSQGNLRPYFRCYIHGGDGGGNDRERNEIKGQSGSNGPGRSADVVAYNEGDIYRFHYFMRIPSSSSMPGNSDSYVFQYHGGPANNDRTQAQLRVVVVNDLLELRGEKQVGTNPPSGEVNFGAIPISQVRNQWIEIEYIIRAATNGRWKCTVWDANRNVIEEFNDTHDTWVGSSSGHMRPKWGIYCDGYSSGERFVDFADFRIQRLSQLP